MLRAFLSEFFSNSFSNIYIIANTFSSATFIKFMNVKNVHKDAMYIYETDYEIGGSFQLP